MARSVIGNLVVELEAQTALFERRMDESRKLLQRVERQGQQTGKGLGGLNRAIGQLRTGMGALGAFLTVDFFADAARGSFDLAAGLGRVRDQTGLTVEEIQQIQAVAADAGLDIDRTTDALVDFAEKMADAANEGGELFEVMERTGLEVQDASGAMRPTIDVLDDLSDIMASTTSEAERNFIATQAMADGGRELVTVMGQGSTAFRELRDEATESGRVLSGEVVEQLDEARAVIDTFAADVGSAWNRAFAATLGFFGGARLQTTTDLIEGIDDLTRMMERGGIGAESARRKIQSYREELERRGVVNVEQYAPAEFLAALGLVEEAAPRAAVAMTEIRDETDGATEAAIRFAQQVSEQVLTPLEQWEAGIEKVLDVQARGFITAEETSRWLAKLRDDYVRLAEAQVESTEATETLGDQLIDTGENAFGRFGDALATTLLTGELNFERFVQSILADLVRLGTRFAATEAFGFLGFGAKGLAIGGGSILPMARGGVVSRPTTIPLASGRALIGEANAEAVLPLHRTGTGELGVRASGMGVAFAPAVTVNVANSGPVAAGGDDALAKQIAELASREVERLWVAEYRRQSSPGGVVNPLTSGGRR